MPPKAPGTLSVARLTGESARRRTTILPSHTFDLASFPERDRFDIWTELISKGVSPSQFTSPHSANFDGFSRTIDLGVPQITMFRYLGLTMNRSHRMIRRGDPEIYQLALPLIGGCALVQERRESVVRPAEFTFISSSRPYECIHLPETAPGRGLRPPPRPTAKTIAINIPQSAIPLPPDKVQRLLATRLPSEGMASLLAQFVTQVAQHPERFRPSDAGQLGSMTLDLVSATLAQHLDLEAALPVEARQQVVRAQIDAFINEHLADPDLNARAVAAAHHISLRTLYRLWKGEDASVAELIRRRRLEQCRRDLANPLLADRPIYAVASRWGLGDRSQFARLFRARYGMSPQEYRQRSTPPRT
ncbi:helix-turn-helix domain-containing protein [Micromonospora sp. NPDC049900]|uniref:helix-turn-helix domain-containing protein n=1 Tax=unclassified Micromonospora TaxID=2617518 RepID=UPI0037A6F87B